MGSGRRLGWERMARRRRAGFACCAGGGAGGLAVLHGLGAWRGGWSARKSGIRESELLARHRGGRGPGSVSFSDGFVESIALYLKALLEYLA